MYWIGNPSSSSSNITYLNYLAFIEAEPAYHKKKGASRNIMLENSHALEGSDFSV
jgi:hypothetical protein